MLEGQSGGGERELSIMSDGDWICYYYFSFIFYLSIIIFNSVIYLFIYIFSYIYIYRL